MDIKILMLASLFGMIATLYHLSDWWTPRTGER